MSEEVMTDNQKNPETKTDRLLRISIGRCIKTAQVKVTEILWSELKERPSNTVRTNETQAEFAKMDKDKANAIKDVGYFVCATFIDNCRSKGNAEEMDIITLDMDFAPTDYLVHLSQVLKGIAYCIYTTHKHTPDNPRLRILIPLGQTVTADEYEPIARKLTESIGMEYFDDTTYQSCRAMYWPSTSSDGEYVHHIGEGDFINPEMVLDSYEDWKDITSWPVSPKEVNKPRRANKEAGNPSIKRGAVGAFCRAYSISEVIDKFIPDTYIPSDQHNRYSYAQGSTANGAVVYDDQFLYSHHDSDPAGGQSNNAFDLVRIHQFGQLDKGAKADTPINKLPSQKAMLTSIEDDMNVKKELLRDNFEGISTSSRVTTPTINRKKSAGKKSAGKKDTGKNSVGKSSAGKNGAGKTNNQTGESDEVVPDWTLELELNKDNRIKGTFLNANLILENDPEIKGKLAYNKLVESQVKIADVPWEACDDNENGVAWEDIDEIRLMDFLARKYQINVPSQTLFKTVSFIAHQNEFHPIENYLNRLSWDGVSRIEQTFTKYLGVKETTYSKAVGKKIFCAAVARVFEPGIKFDYVPILEGKQGTRKSMFIKAMAGQWFGDNISSFKGKEAVEAMMGVWIIEISELEAFGKSEIEGIKAFMSRTEDRVRLAYGMHPKKFPRRCIFIGTTNDEEYLKDPTGNRRFWPLKCEAETIDITAFDNERDQLWAEAVVLYKAGETLYLDKDEEPLATIEQEKRVSDEGWLSAISLWLDELIPTNYYDIKESEGRVGRVGEGVGQGVGVVERDKTFAAEIWTLCLGGELKDLNGARKRQIERTMKQIKTWRKVDYGIRFGERYSRNRGFVRIETEEKTA